MVDNDVKCKECKFDAGNASNSYSITRDYECTSGRHPTHTNPPTLAYCLIANEMQGTTCMTCESATAIDPILNVGGVCKPYTVSVDDDLNVNPVKNLVKHYDVTNSKINSYAVCSGCKPGYNL